MKLSVLIPTHNYRCYTLVADLQRQLELSGVEYEVIVAEDGSRDQVSIISNHRINELPSCRHIIRRENVGRAAIRNFLAREAQGEWLLFIDCDARVVDNDFIRRYLECCHCDYDAVSGDLVNPDTLPSPDVTLRYRYEKSCEQYRTAALRNRHPYARFSTFNVMIRRSAFMQILFDERCTEYGYEDTLMGLELERRGYRILHIDNPLMHMGFEPNSVYLGKVETSLRTLRSISGAIIGETRMTALHGRLSRARILWLVRLLFRILRPLLRRNLVSRHPSVRALSFYKLGYYSTL